MEPPKELRTIIEKTASFVATKGESFEQKLAEREKDNPSFAFLKTDSPYNLFYKQKLHEFVIGNCLCSSSLGTFVLITY